MANNIIGKVVLITGISSGIGLETAKYLKSKGARVIGTVRDHFSQADIINRYNIEVFIMDMSFEDSIASATSLILQATNNQIDFLFHNVGYAQPGAIEDLPIQALRKQFETNFFSIHLLTTLLIPRLLVSSKPKIIINSSILGVVAMPYRGAYVASKFALEGWADVLRLELHDTPISVTLIEPGPINTRFRENAYHYYQKNIDPSKSRHKDKYQLLESKLTADTSQSMFALSAHTCAELVYKICLKENPKARYTITIPSKLFSVLKKLLPTYLLDIICIRGI